MSRKGETEGKKMTNVLFSKKRRLIAILLALALALSFGAVFGGTQAYAATNDDFMMSYDDSPGGGIYQYTYVLDPNDPYYTPEVYLQVGPADSNALPSYFDSEADAQDVIDNGIDIISGDGIEGAYVAYAAPFEFNPGEWVVEAVIELPDDDSYGAISVKVTNTAYDGTAAKDPYTNITIVRQSYQTVTSVSGINSTVALTNSSYAQLTLAKTLSSQTIAYNTFSELYPNRNFPTAADGTYQPWYDNTYAAPVGQTTITNVHSTYSPGIGYLLDSITANSTQYDNEGDDPDGRSWLFAVYRNGSRVELSKYIGFDSFRLFPGDHIQWRYWYYDDYDNVFPPRK
jgi:hypothetical protein